ncbi:hypothetical protein C8R45DRAFT_929267 [Mycena sanguinolenta]|nr:hypothetical protein C8R45DRAFT_929267 [Mycena sanguinolenta]
MMNGPREEKVVIAICELLSKAEQITSSPSISQSNPTATSKPPTEAENVAPFRLDSKDDSGECGTGDKNRRNREHEYRIVSFGSGPNRCNCRQEMKIHIHAILTERDQTRQGQRPAEQGSVSGRKDEKIRIQLVNRLRLTSGHVWSDESKLGAVHKQYGDRDRDIVGRVPIRSTMSRPSREHSTNFFSFTTRILLELALSCVGREKKLLWFMQPAERNSVWKEGRAQLRETDAVPGRNKILAREARSRLHEQDVEGHLGRRVPIRFEGIEVDLASIQGHPTALALNFKNSAGHGHGHSASVS